MCMHYYQVMPSQLQPRYSPHPLAMQTPMFGGGGYSFPNVPVCLPLLVRQSAYPVKMEWQSCINILLLYLHDEVQETSGIVEIPHSQPSLTIVYWAPTLFLTVVTANNFTHLHKSVQEPSDRINFAQIFLKFFREFDCKQIMRYEFDVNISQQSRLYVYQQLSPANVKKRQTYK